MALFLTDICDSGYTLSMGAENHDAPGVRAPCSRRFGAAGMLLMQARTAWTRLSPLIRFRSSSCGLGHDCQVAGHEAPDERRQGRPEEAAVYPFQDRKEAKAGLCTPQDGMWPEKRYYARLRAFRFPHTENDRSLMGGKTQNRMFQW